MEHSVGKRRWLRVSTILAATAVFVAACGTTTTGGGETPKNGGTLVWAIDSDATSLNPFVISTLPEFRIMSFLLPNLYSIDKNLNVVPDLADGFPSVSSDGTVWTVKTKKNAKWSDGSPIGADDVIATEKIQADPNLDTD